MTYTKQLRMRITRTICDGALILKIAMRICRHSKDSVPFLQTLDKIHGHTGPTLMQGQLKVLEGDRTNLLESTVNRLFNDCVPIHNVHTISTGTLFSVARSSSV